MSTTQIMIDYQGKQVTASLEEPTMWYVTIGGTALTKLPASSVDNDAMVRARVLQWLRDHPDMLDRDQIVLGGG